MNPDYKEQVMNYMEEHEEFRRDAMRYRAMKRIFFMPDDEMGKLDRACFERPPETPDELDKQVDMAITILDTPI